MVTGQSDPTKNITVKNLWKNGARVVLGCNCLSNGHAVMKPYYISPPSVLGEKRVLTPVQSFSVLFTDSIKVKAMIDVKAKGEFGRFEITKGQNEGHVKYDTYNSVELVKDHWQSVENAEKL